MPSSSLHVIPFAFLLVILALPAVGSAAADPPAILQFDAPRLDVTVRPGEKFIGQFTLTNNSDRQVAVRFHAADRRVRPGGKVEMARGLMLLTSASQWVTLSPYDESLGPRESKEFGFSVQLPEQSTASGDYTTMVLAEVATGGLAVASRADQAGLLLVVNVPGAPDTQARIVGLDCPPERLTLLPKLLPGIPAIGFALPGWLRQSQPIRVAFSFANEGNVRTTATGYLLVTSGDATLSTIPAGAASEVFPGDATDFVAVWPDPPMVGSYRLVARVEMDGSRVVEQSFPVHLLPWPVVLALLVVLLAAGGVGGYLWFRKRRREAAYFDDESYLPEQREKPSMASAAWRTPARPARTRVDRDGSPPDPPQRRQAPPGAGPPPKREDALWRRGRGDAAGVAERPRPTGSNGGNAGTGEVDRLVGAGLAAVQLGAYPEAHEYFDAATRQDEKCIEAWLLKGGTARSTSEAEECLRRALALDPSNAWAVEGLRLLADSTEEQ